MNIPLDADGQPACTVHVPEGPWQQVLDVLDARFPQIGRPVWIERMRRGRVLDAAHRPLAPDARCRPGMRLHYFREVAEEPGIAARERLLHVDEDLVVADKPPWLPVMPAGRFVRETLLARLQTRLRNRHLVPLHRIDRDTSGLVLFSARRASRAAYAALFAERRISKTYEALLDARPGLRLPQARHSRIVRGEPFFRMREADGAANAYTRIELVQRLDNVLHVRLWPLSGRKHQLRVHMAALGAPILHDRLYPDLGQTERDDLQSPLALLACELAFIDPLDGRRRHFRSTRHLHALASMPDGPDMAG